MKQKFSLHFKKSCIASGGKKGCIRFFRSKQAYMAFSKFRLFAELFVAMIDKFVFSFLPMWASKGDIFVTPCRVVLSVFKNEKFGDVWRKFKWFVVFVYLPWSRLRFQTCIIRSLLLWFFDHLEMQINVLCQSLCKKLEIFLKTLGLHLRFCSDFWLLYIYFFPWEFWSFVHIN